MVVGCLEVGEGRMVPLTGMDSLRLAFGLVCLSEGGATRLVGVRRSLPGLTIGLGSPR